MTLEVVGTLLAITIVAGLANLILVGQVLRTLGVVLTRLSRIESHEPPQDGGI
jgi:hypothetical protein